VSQDFLIQLFFLNHLPQPPENNIRAISLFQKFAEMFASEGAPPVSTTPVANLPPVSTTPAASFATSTAGAVYNGGK
jgi:hypothetical protein